MVWLNTFSIVARCPATGMLGVAVSTAVPGVGGLCPYVRSRVGAIATQAWVNPYLAIDALSLMAKETAAQTALDAVLSADDSCALRQIGIVDAQGRSAAFTGDDCTPWCGHIVDAGFAIQGNMLTGPATLETMAESFRASASLDLSERLMRALEAGQAAGGDKRGKQSAALRVHHVEEYAWLDLRVDEHPDPVPELRRVYTVAQAQLLPFTAGMPRRGTAASALPAEVSAMLLRPPAERPGGALVQDTSDDLYHDLLGIDLAPERRAEILRAYSTILKAVKRLRTLNLTDAHPAVIFDLNSGSDERGAS
jgi:uncharacterized Ntn-hydrolase superfamily protein